MEREEGMREYLINTYQEAIEVIKEVGILPLAGLVPNHPSLASITPEANWHTGSELDPWRWRTKFAVDGEAAYGKFLKKKAVLIAREWFPLVQAILGSKESMARRYEAGLVSHTAYQLYQLIQEEEGIETRALRTKAKLKDKESKKIYEQGITELQGSLDIVIAGVKPRTNELGEVNGWNSTSFQTTAYWMQEVGLEASPLSKEEAVEELIGRLKMVSTPEALRFFTKQAILLKGQCSNQNK